MSGVIRKLTLSYPLMVEDRQQKSVFSVGDTKSKVGGNLIKAIREVLNHDGKLTYQVILENDGRMRVWKEITPYGCTVEIEYHIEDK